MIFSSIRLGVLSHYSLLSPPGATPRPPPLAQYQNLLLGANKSSFGGNKNQRKPKYKGRKTLMRSFAGKLRSPYGLAWFANDRDVCTRPKNHVAQTNLLLLRGHSRPSRKRKKAEMKLHTCCQLPLALHTLVTHEPIFCC